MHMTIMSTTPTASTTPRAAARTHARLHPHALALACALALAPALALAQQAGTRDPHAGHTQHQHTPQTPQTPQTPPEHPAEHGQDAEAADGDHAQHDGHGGHHTHDQHTGHAGHAEHTPPAAQTSAAQMDHQGHADHGQQQSHGDDRDHDDHQDHGGHGSHGDHGGRGDHSGHAMQQGHPSHDAHQGHGAGMPMHHGGDLPADAAPLTPIPPITEADRIAAQGPAAHGEHDGDDMHAAHGDNAHDRRIYSYVLFDRLETWDAAPGSGEAWEVAGWVGRDIDKLRVRSEGERKHGHLESADLELLYSRAIAPWWDLTAGVRHDFAPGASQDWAAIGVIGMAPYKFEVEATAYVGASGRTALRAEAEYSLLLTDRLILQPLVEAEWHGRSDAARGVGAGLGKVETGLRLRYEIRREFAPYVGIVHERSFGRSADFQREEGEDTRDTRVVFGVRMWF